MLALITKAVGLSPSVFLDPNSLVHCLVTIIRHRERGRKTDIGPAQNALKYARLAARDRQQCVSVIGRKGEVLGPDLRRRHRTAHHGEQLRPSGQMKRYTAGAFRPFDTAPETLLSPTRAFGAV